MSGAAAVAAFEAVWPDGRREPVRLGLRLAEGGDAAVHAVEGHPALVAKVYHDPGTEPRRRAKLDAMLAAPPEGAGGADVRLAWPVALLEDGGDGPPAGFLMPRVDLDRAVVLEMLLTGRARRAAGLSDAYRDRVAAAANLAAAVAALHARGDHVVDLKPSNAHVYRGSFLVALLDCDGMSVAAPDGAGRFPAHQYTDGYIAPEALRAKARPEDLGEAQDRFALAVVVFQLLNRGLHPFQGVPAPGAEVPTTDGERVAAGLYPYGPGGAGRLTPPPRSLYGGFDAATQRLFDRAFAGGAGRPTAQEWWAHLRGLLDSGLRPCAADADHARFGERPCAVCGGGAGSSVVEAPTPEAERAAEYALSLHERHGRTPSRPAASPSYRPSGWAAAPPVTRQASALGRSALALLILGAVFVLYRIIAPSPGPDDGAAWDGVAEQAPMRAPNEVLRTALMFSRTDQAIEALEAGADVRSPRPSLGYLYEDLGYEPVEGPTTVDRIDPDMPRVQRAAFDGALPILFVLLEYGADVDERDPVLRTPLMTAARSVAPWGMRGSVEAAVALGSDLATTTQRVVQPRVVGDNDAAWGRGVQRDLSGPTYNRLLRAFGWGGAVSQDAPDSLQTQALGVAASVAGLRLLLDAGADVDARDGWGRTALTYAAAVGNAAAVRVLLSAGATPDAADAAGTTPLMAAADGATDPASDLAAAATVRELLRGGASPDARDRAGRTAADFVGDRPATRRVKARSPSLDAAAPLDRSETLAVLRRAAVGSALTDDTPPAATAPPSRRADLADGATRIEGAHGEPAPPDAEPVPWRQSGPLVVECYVATADRIDVEVPVWLRRTDRFAVGRRYRIDVPDEAEPCRSNIWNALGGRFDVTGDPERWPSGVARVRVVRPQPSAP